MCFSWLQVVTRRNLGRLLEWTNTTIPWETFPNQSTYTRYTISSIPQHLTLLNQRQHCLGHVNWDANHLAHQWIQQFPFSMRLWVKNLGWKFVVLGNKAKHFLSISIIKSIFQDCPTLAHYKATHKVLTNLKRCPKNFLFFPHIPTSSVRGF